MKCENAVVLLSGHLDGMNTEQQELQLQKHLCGCASCRRVLSSYENTDRAIASKQFTAPAGLSGEIAKKLI